MSETGKFQELPIRMQRAAGVASTAGIAPKTVDNVLSREGSPLPSGLKDEMSERFGRDFSRVRIHTGSLAEQSAKDINAKAYTVGHNIVFGAGGYAPEAPHGKELLAHELTHVVQQSTPGDIVYVARSVEDWLTGSVNITAMTYTQLLEEINDLTQYLDRQTSSSSDAVTIQQALAALRAEVNRRETATRLSKSRGRGATKRAPESAEPLPARYPRILTEMTSVVYSDPAEMREEYDLIMEWLARPEISANERQILTTERNNLAPQLRSDLERVAAVHHAERVQAALTPEAEDDAHTLENVARTIEGIRPEPGNADVFNIYDRGERIRISRQQAAQLRANLLSELRRATRGIQSRATYYWDRYNAQLEINRESPVVSGISGWLGNVEDPGDELISRYYWVFNRVRRIENSLRENRPVEAAAMLPQVEFVGQEMRQLSRAFYEGYIEGAETAVRRLEFTRDASFAIAGAIAAVVAAPVVAGFVGAGGLGATGVVATGLNIAGTGLVVGTGTAVVRGGSAAAGTGIAGGSVSEAASAFSSEAKRGFREGFINGGAGAAGRLLGPALGVGTSLGQQALRRIATEAIVNGTATMVDVLWQSGSLGDAVAAGLRAAVLSGPGAYLGGSNSPIVRYMAAPLTAGGTAYLGARANGATPEQAMEAAGIAVTTNLVLSGHSQEADAALVEKGQAWGSSTRKAASTATRRVASIGAAIMIGTSEAVPPLRSGFGGTPIEMPTVSSMSATSSSTSSVAPVEPKAKAPTPDVRAGETATAPSVAPAAGETEKPSATAVSSSPEVSTPTPSAASTETPATETAAPVAAASEQPAETPETTTTTAPNPVDDLNVEAAFSPGAPMEVSDPRMTGRTQASGRSRNFASLTRLVVTAAQRIAAIGLHGQRLNAALRQAWLDSRNAREVADLQAISNHWNAGRRERARVLAREAFDRHRGRFWRAVRADPALQRIFTDAGMVFAPGSGAPIYVDPVTGDRLDFMSLEHQTRLADDPTRALDPGNLQTVLGDENSVTLEWIRRNDPFQ